MKFNIFELGIFSFNSYVYYRTRGFIVSNRAFNLLTRAFNLTTRAFNLATRVFSLLSRGFKLVTRVSLSHKKSVLTVMIKFCQEDIMISDIKYLLKVNKYFTIRVVII